MATKAEILKVVNAAIKTQRIRVREEKERLQNMEGDLAELENMKKMLGEKKPLTQLFLEQMGLRAMDIDEGPLNRDKM